MSPEECNNNESIKADELIDKITLEGSSKSVGFTKTNIYNTTNNSTIYLSTNSKYAIIFENCCFINDLIIQDSIIDSDLTFKNCRFKNIKLNVNTEINGKLSFLGCNANNFDLDGGKYKDIYLEFEYGVKYRFENGTFGTIFLKGYEHKEIDRLDIRFGNTELHYEADSTYGNVQIANQKINTLTLNGINKNKRITIYNLKVNSFSISNYINEGQINIYKLDSFEIPNKKSDFTIHSSPVGKLFISRGNMRKFKKISVIDSFINECVFINMDWGKNPLTKSFDKDKSNFDISTLKQIRDNYRQLRYIHDKQGDRIEENIFYAYEMTTYGKILRLQLEDKESKTFTQRWNTRIDKWIINVDSYFNYGRSVLKPFFWLLGMTFVIFLGFNFLGNTIINLDFCNPSSEAFGKGVYYYLNLLNPTHKFKDEYYGWKAFFDFLSRISSGYFIFNFIKALRKFVR